MNTKNFNTIYEDRGHPFSIKDYSPNIQKIWNEKCRNVDEIVSELPSKFNFATSFLAAQARGFLRALSKRKNFEHIELFGGFLLEPYDFLSSPNTTYRTFYYGPVERLLQYKMGKTVHLIPKQYTQVCSTIDYYSPEYVIHSGTIPDKDGYINLSLNNAADEPCLRENLKSPDGKVIIEINTYNPWVAGDPKFGDHKVHLSEVDFVYENHEPLFQLPLIEATEKEKSIGATVCQYVKDKATIQFGIGGIPNYSATLLTDRKDIGIHTEMLTDWIVDLAQAGVITNRYKEVYKDVSVCGFIVGTDKIYDWVHLNPDVCILPINYVNDIHVVSQISNFVSLNAGLMIDFSGQICSESLGHRQYSGTGGQFEFVQGAYLSPGGKSLVCIKASKLIKDKLNSNILPSLPPGAAVTVLRNFADTIITEYGAADLLYQSRLERAKSLIQIADPECKEKLIEECVKLALSKETEGFGKISQKALYKTIGILSRLRNFFKGKKRK